MQHHSHMLSLTAKHAQEHANITANDALELFIPLIPTNLEYDEQESLKELYINRHAFYKNKTIDITSKI